MSFRIGERCEGKKWGETGFLLDLLLGIGLVTCTKYKCTRSQLISPRLSSLPMRGAGWERRLTMYKMEDRDTDSHLYFPRGIPCPLYGKPYLS